MNGGHEDIQQKKPNCIVTVSHCSKYLISKHASSSKESDCAIRKIEEA